MDPSIDDFIQYNNDFSFKPTPGLFGEDFSLSSPFSEHSDATSLFPSFLPKTIQNILDPEEAPKNKELPMPSEVRPLASKKITQLVKSKKSVGSEPSEVSEYLGSLDESNSLASPVEFESKINTRSKKIQKPKEMPKPVKAEKKGKQPKRNATEALLKKVDKKFIPEGFDDPDMDDKTRKKMVQMIRNRVSAQVSRDRKKAYFAQVEETKDKLSQDNDKLSKENARLLERIKKLEQENATLKHSAGSQCAKCGFTLECESPNTAIETDDNSLLGRSNNSSPLRRANRGGMFGFSMAFAVIVCFLLFLNGGSLGDFTPQGEKLKKMKPTFQFVSKLLDSQMNRHAYMNPEKYGQGERPKQSDIEIMESFERAWRSFEIEPFGIMEKIKPLMDQFDSLHQSTFKSSENNKNIINLPDTQNALGDASLKIETLTPYNNNDEVIIEEETIMKNKDKTSTLFCPTGFEFSRKGPSTDMEVEGENSSYSSTLTRRRTLGAGKAEFIQLLLPKYAIGQNFMESVNGTANNLPTFQKFEEEGSLVEVWCKIFAVRELSNLANLASATTF